MPSRKEIVEQELYVKVPDQYAAYLEKYGIFHTFGIEVYGISDDLSTYKGIPCVIGATEKYREAENLPHRFLVLQHTGIEDEMICLDTEDEKSIRSVGCSETRRLPIRLMNGSREISLNAPSENGRTSMLERKLFLLIRESL